MARCFAARAGISRTMEQVSGPNALGAYVDACIDLFAVQLSDEQRAEVALQFFRLAEFAGDVAQFALPGDAPPSGDMRP